MKVDHAAQCRFFSAEDACRIALQAYYAASKWIEPPKGEDWLVEGVPYASSGDFADGFSAELQARLSLLALEKTGEFFVSYSDPVLQRIAAQIEPEKMAPIIAKWEADIADARADIFGESVNGLPPGENAADNALSLGVENA